MATRVYLPSSGTTPGISPAVGSGWTATASTGFVRINGVLTRINSTLTDHTSASPSATNPSTYVFRQYIIGPLAAQTVSGSLTGIVRGLESATTFNATIAIAVRQVNGAGTHVNDILSVAASDNTAAAPPEFGTSAATRRFNDSAESATLSLTSRTLSDGDFIVIEIGARKASTSTTATVTLRFGDSNASDFAHTDGLTTDLNPWVEFSGDLVFLQGQDSQDLPAAFTARRRLRDYTLTNGPTGLYLLDTPPDFTPPPGAQLQSQVSFSPDSKNVYRAKRITWANRFVDGTATPAEALPEGEQRTDLPPRAAARARDYSFVNQTDILLIGQDRIYGDPGQTPEYDWQTSVPPRGPARLPSYSWTHHNPNLTHEDLPYGADRTELPPAARARSRDYTFVHETDVTLISQDRIYGDPGQIPDYDWPVPRGPRRLRDYTWTWFNPNTQPAAEDLPPGVQRVELAPKGQARARDYTWLQPVEIQLIGQDRVYGDPGQAVTYDWQRPPRGPARLPDYTWLVFNPNLYVESPPPGAERLELPPAARARSRDYTYVHETDVTLIGQDRLYGDPGEAPAYDWQLPKHPRRLRDYTWLSCGAHYSNLYPSAESLPPGLQATDLPPKAPRRQRDYTWLASSVEYIAQDRFYGDPGQSPTYDWQRPPRGASRARDYSWTFHNPNIYPDVEALPPGVQYSALPPKAPRKLRDYTWVITGVRYIGQDRVYGDPGQAPTYDWQLPPKGPRRARDYTWLASSVEYIGQDRIYGAPGEAPAYDWQLPKVPERLVDYTYVYETTDLIGQDRIYAAPGEAPVYHWPVPPGYRRPANLQEVPNIAALGEMAAGARNLDWDMGAPGSPWNVGGPQSGWRTGNVQGGWILSRAQE